MWELCTLFPTPFIAFVLHVASRTLRQSVSIQDSCLEPISFISAGLEQKHAPETSLCRLSPTAGLQGCVSSCLTSPLSCREAGFPAASPHVPSQEFICGRQQWPFRPLCTSLLHLPEPMHRGRHHLLTWRAGLGSGVARPISSPSCSPATALATASDSRIRWIMGSWGGKAATTLGLDCLQEPLPQEHLHDMPPHTSTQLSRVPVAVIHLPG